MHLEIVYHFHLVYTDPLSSGWVYRVNLDDIANTERSQKELGRRDEKYTEEPNNGGLRVWTVKAIYT